MTCTGVQPFTASRTDLTSDSRALGRVERARAVVATAHGALSVIVADSTGLRRIDAWVGDDLAVLHVADRRPARLASGAICPRVLLYGAIGSVIQDLVGEFPDRTGGPTLDLTALSGIEGGDEFPSHLDWVLYITSVGGGRHDGWVGASTGQALYSAPCPTPSESVSLTQVSAASGWLDVAHTVGFVALDQDPPSPPA